MANNRPARLSTDPALLDILVCPLTGGPLEIAGDELLSRSARLAFPVRSGIPILVASEARPLEDPATPSRDRKAG